MLSEEQITLSANRLYEAEKKCIQIRALTMDYDLDMDDAYAIQKIWVDRKIAEGASVLGYKIGLTSKAMQAAVHIDQPDYGVLLDDMLIANGSRVRAADFSDPRIEAEFAFFLKAPLAGENVTLDEVLQATDYVVPALELIAARSYRVDPETGYTRKVFDTIADNAANAGVILGNRQIAPTDVDLRWAGALLYLNGSIEETGLAAGVLDHPANGIAWLCKYLAAHEISLKPGQLLLAGSFTRPVAVGQGDQIYADYGPFGDISLDFV